MYLYESYYSIDVILQVIIIIIIVIEKMEKESFEVKVMDLNCENKYLL